MSEKINEVVLAFDKETGNEAIFVNGKLVDFDATIYCCDVAKAVKGLIVTIRQEFVDLPEGSEWPKTTEGLSLSEPSNV